MRGVETRIQEIRHRIFREVARMAYHTEWQVDKRIEELPYEIVPGEVGNFRNDIFLERAIVGERLRLAMGLPYRSAADHSPISDGIEAADKPETYYTPPLINIIKFACHGCKENQVVVTEGCQGCLAHPCVEVCPKGAVSLARYNGRSVIDQEKCIKCGRCVEVCSYNAIIHQKRPCAAACGMDAIRTNQNGKADIDYDKCVSCGMCLVNCPFGAIADKSQIFQVIRAIQSGERVYAAVAPAFVGQFGPKVTPGRLRAAMKQLGFADVFEVAIGADLCAAQEADDFLEEVPEKLPFMATSCCPAWSTMAKKLYPDYANCISMALTPMTLTARLIKHQHKNAKVVFIGPCAAKKLEAMRTDVRSEVDFVLTFEEMAGIFDAKHVELTMVPEDPASTTLRPTVATSPSPAEWRRRSSTSSRRSTLSVRSKSPTQRACVNAATCLPPPRPASTTATCWKAWPVRAAASQARVPCSRSASPPPRSACTPSRPSTRPQAARNTSRSLTSSLTDRLEKQRKAALLGGLSVIPVLIPRS